MHDLKKDLIDAPEIAKQLNKTIATIHRYRKIGTMPQPKYKLNTVYLWDRAEVTHWLATEHGLFKACNDAYFDGELQK